MKKLYQTGVVFLFATILSATPSIAQKKIKKSQTPIEQKEVVPDSSAEELPIPDPIGLVSDFGNLFTPGQEDTLSEMIRNFKDSTQDEIAIAAWDTLHLIPSDMDAYVTRVTEAWDVGDKGRGNGIVIAFSVQLRKIRILNATGGLTDKDSREIVHKIMLPYFAAKDYYRGTLMGLQAVIKKLTF